MKKIIYLISFWFLLSCRGETETKTVSHDTNKTIQQPATLSTKNEEIDFNLDNLEKIKGYKQIDFKSAAYNYDKYLLNIDSIVYNNCYNKKAKVKDLELEPDSFTLVTKYANVKFNSIQEEETFLKYQYNCELPKAGYDVVTAWTIDTPITVFLNKEKEESFITSGTVTVSNDKQYFISTSNEPDHCILEIYKIENNRIINIVNLYSIKNPMESICWGNQLFFEYVSNEKKSYFILDLNKILMDFEKKK